MASMTSALFQLELNSAQSAECASFAEQDVPLGLVCGLGRRESQWMTQAQLVPAKNATLPNSSSENLVIYDCFQLNPNLQ